MSCHLAIAPEPTVRLQTTLDKWRQGHYFVKVQTPKDVRLHFAVTKPASGARHEIMEPVL